MLKGLHKVRRKLASGAEGLHFYAWRGGPRMVSAFGTPDFVAEFQRLTAGRDRPTHHDGTLQSLINAYQRAPAFTDLMPGTQADYARRIRKIETAFGDMPLAAIADPRVRGEFLQWRDDLAAKGPREADYCFAVLARVLSWAHDRRTIPTNPCERPGRLSSGSRADAVWTDAQIEALLAVASPQVALMVHLAVNTGQRQGDLRTLPWSAYDGQSIRLRQSKTGRNLTIPVTADLARILDATKQAKRRAVQICTTSRGTPWTADGFKTSFGKTRDAAQIEGLTFHDFRGTTVLRLAAAGCTVPEIAAITGHALKDAETILDRHYLSRDRSLGESAISKLEKHRTGTKDAN
ncbi:MAG: tyrosine-type recombinase/integrase [Paracoccaceae bacterium]